MSKTENLPIDQVEPNKYNPNVLKGEKFEALKKDVAAGNYDPILVSPKDVFYGEPSEEGGSTPIYVIIDGQWRWTAAKELKLTTIKAEIREIAIHEAKPITFKKNRQRGNLDPFKEAKLFDEEVTRGLTEQQVADRFRVSRSYVAGRRSLLKVSDKVVEFFEAPEKALKNRVRTKIEKSLQEEPHLEHTEEEIAAHIEKEVSQVVTRGTLTPGHLRTLSSLPKEHQVEVTEEIIHQGLSVRDTEEKVQNLHESLAREKRFKEALETAKQPTCPECGASPRDFQVYNEKYFRCSNCYCSWDFMVTKKELEERKKQSVQEDKTKQSQKLKDAHTNPAYIRRIETVEEMDPKIREWVLRKTLQLDSIIEISVTGTRGKDIVSFDYPGSWKHSLQFNVGKERSGADSIYSRYEWENQFSFSMENKDYKKVDAKAKLDIQNPSPEKRAEVHRFLDEIVNTDQDPFLPQEAKQGNRKSKGESNG